MFKLYNLERIEQFEAFNNHDKEKAKKVYQEAIEHGWLMHVECSILNWGPRELPGIHIIYIMELDDIHHTNYQHTLPSMLIMSLVTKS